MKDKVGFRGVGMKDISLDRKNIWGTCTLNIFDISILGKVKRALGELKTIKLSLL